MRAALSLSVHSLRIAAARAAPVAARVAAPRVAPAAARALHASAARRAEPQDDPQLAALRQKIQNHDGCRNAIIKLGELMAKKGVDLTKPPTTMQMMKLGMDAEIREAGANLMAQLKDAGVDMNPEIASQIFSKVVKDQ